MQNLSESWFTAKPRIRTIREREFSAIKKVVELGYEAVKNYAQENNATFKIETIAPYNYKYIYTDRYGDVFEFHRNSFKHTP